MGRPNQKTSVYSNTRSTLSTGTPSAERITTGWPVGDTLLKSILLRVRTKVNVSTALVTRGRARFMRGISFKTEKHGFVYEGIDGLLAQVMSWALLPDGQGYRIGADDADDEFFLKLPFQDNKAARPEDLALDLLKVARPEMILEFGNAADIESTASTTLDNLDIDVVAEVDPGPVDIGANGPIMMPHFSVLKVDVNQTVKAFKISLPYGDRTIKRIFVTQRNGSTLAELNNTIIGAAATDKVSLKVNGYAWYDGVLWSLIQNENYMDYPKYAADRGVGILDFAPRKTGGARLSEALAMITRDAGRADLEVDVTSVSNGQVWVGLESAKPLPEQALRPSPEPKKA